MSTTELLKGAAELFPDEVVTSANVRHLDLPFGAGRFALITLDNGFDHTKPTTFGPASLANLNAAIDQVEKEAAMRRHRRSQASPASRSSSRSAPTSRASSC